MGRVKDFGVALESLPGAEFPRLARLAEELGIDTWWIPEDYFFRGAFTLAGAIASSTERIKIGLGVVNPYTRHPALTAMEFGALDELSGGRAVLGIGAGVRFWIEDQMRIPYRSPTKSMRETIEIIRRLLRRETVSAEGAMFQTRGVKLNFQPVRAEIPIHVGVLGPKNLEMAGEAGDGLLLSAMTSPAYVRFAVEHARRGAARAGRSLEAFSTGAILLVSISEDGRAAREAVKPLLATLISLMKGHPDNALFQTAGLEVEEVLRFGERFSRGDLPVDLVTDWMIDTFAVAGTPAHCRKIVEAYVDAGIDSPVAFEVPGIGGEETIRNVATHLLPHFR